MNVNNTITLIGRLTKDVELNKTNDTTFAKGTIAVKRAFKNKEGNYDSDFFDFNASGTTAEYLSKYTHKGNQVAILGELRQEKWQDKDGNTKSAIRVRVDSATSLEKKEDTPKEEPKTTTKNAPKVSDDDLPF